MRILLLASFLASTLMAKGNIENGRVLYSQRCVKCHGVTGDGLEEEDAPRLRGQFAWYIESQVKAFQNKTRNNPKMLPFIKGLNDKNIKDISSYIESMK